MPGTINSIPRDTDVINEAARLIRSIDHDAGRAKRGVLTWLLILAALENTTPSAILDNLVRSQPGWQAQRGLVRRLQREVAA